LDNLTHTLVGWTLARAGLGRRTEGATAAIIVASNAPDIDFVSAFTGGSVGYLAAHRGATHGPIGIAALALGTLLAVLAWRLLRGSRRPVVRREVLVLAGVSLLGTTLHVLMDLPTSYGTRALSPMDRTWYAVDWLPIIEVYLWGLLALGLIAMRGRAAWWGTIGRTVIVLVLGLYVLRAATHHRALNEATAHDGRGEPAPCAESPTLVRHPTVFEAATAGPGACLRAAALPTFLSPFTWRLVRQYGGGYELREWSAIGGTTATGAIWIPSETDRWVLAARQAPAARVFLNFSRFPASRSAILPDGTRRVRFVDVRFVGSPFGLSPDPEARPPFIATVELSPDGRVLDQRLGP
jgi:membrane-bound metal-dependent hydrolase YbcI (DUF457 family)